MVYYERNLPHWQPEGRPLFITWRLWGSMPASAWATAKGRIGARTLAKTQTRGQECPRHRRPSFGEYFLVMDRLLDTVGQRFAWLRDSRVAGAVVVALERGQDELGQYRLHAFVVMPNHVHILIEPYVEAVSLLKGLKGTTARAANRILRRTGRPFWQNESFDHWVRGTAEFERIRLYIERNPVTAGLARRPEEWPWSSASRGTGTPARAQSAGTSGVSRPAKTGVAPEPYLARGGTLEGDSAYDSS
jgi:REP-associated tyrosine transposase